MDEGHRLHTVVPARTWFGATVVADDTTVAEEGSYALVGCTTAPAFDFADVEPADRATLTQDYPQHHALIERLTRPE